MAAGYTTRKLQVFSLHARDASGPVSYLDLASAMAKVTPGIRQAQRGDRVVAVATFDVSKGVAWFIAHEGALDQNPLIFDRTRSTERVGQLSAGEVVATRTHGFIDFEKREAIVEYNHRGAKASDVAAVMSSAAAKVWKRDWVTVELNPKADQSFARELARFKRIQLASAKMTIPNSGWTDYKSHMTQMAEESEGHTIEVEISAGRRGSLNPVEGLIALIRDAANAERSALQGAAVTGYREEEEAITTISLARHIEHQSVAVRKTQDGHVDTKDIRRKLTDFLRSRASKRRAE